MSGAPQVRGTFPRKLTDTQARFVRIAYATGMVSYADLARTFGVSVSTIATEVRNKYRRVSAPTNSGPAREEEM